MKKIILAMAVVVFLSQGLHAKNVDVWVEGGNGSVYAAGEKVSVKVLPHVSGYLYLYNIDSEGRVHVLFPRGRYGQGNYVRAGRVYHLPYDFRLETEWYAGGEPGVEYVYAVVTPYPLPYVEAEWFIPLPPDEYYYDDDILVCFRFAPPHFFPRIYFHGWAYFYVRPRYYVYYYHPTPWYCYDCHHPHVIVGFWFDFCPIYVVEVHEYGYYYYPRYYRTYKYKYRIRPIYRKISPKKVREYREIEKRYRSYDRPPVWAVKNPLREKKEDVSRKYIKGTDSKKVYREKPYERDRDVKVRESQSKKTYQDNRVYRGKPSTKVYIDKGDEKDRKKSVETTNKKKTTKKRSYQPVKEEIAPEKKSFYRKNNNSDRFKNKIKIDKKPERGYNYKSYFKTNKAKKR